jgi:hypothetical protein
LRLGNLAAPESVFQIMDVSDKAEIEFSGLQTS